MAVDLISVISHLKEEFNNAIDCVISSIEDGEHDCDECADQVSNALQVRGIDASDRAFLEELKNS